MSLSPDSAEIIAFILIGMKRSDPVVPQIILIILSTILLARFAKAEFVPLGSRKNKDSI